MAPATALKEWAIAVTALAAGEMIILLRKGGIREPTGHLVIAPDRAIAPDRPDAPIYLYPTYEHQRPDQLKSPYNQQVTIVPAGWHPETVAIHAIATITETTVVPTTAALTALSPYHIWQPSWALDRFNWKPQDPLTLLFLRVAKLSQPLILPYQSAYGGCRSWLSLDLPTAIADRTISPVLSPNDYAKRVNQIHAALKSSPAPP